MEFYLFLRYAGRTHLPVHSRVMWLYATCLQIIAPAEAFEMFAYSDSECQSMSQIVKVEVVQPDGFQTITLLHVIPLCAPFVWNVYEAAVHGNKRTNNLCEGWNNKTAILIPIHHPATCGGSLNKNLYQTLLYRTWLSIIRQRNHRNGCNICALALMLTPVEFQ